MKTVLLTGSAGRIGSMLHRAWSESGRYNLIATARNEDPPNGVIAMDLLDAARVAELTKGVDAVVHLAAYLGANHFVDKGIPNNVIGTYHLLEAMRANGVPRMVYGGTNHSVGFYRDTDKLDGDSAARPDSCYGLTKAMAELTGRMYSDKYGISFINIRIGSYNTSDHVVSYRRTRTWVSQRDLLHLMECAIDAPESVKYLNTFGISDNSERFWDIEDAKALLAYRPLDNGHEHLAEALERNSYNGTDDNGYMGADFIWGRE